MNNEQIVEQIQNGYSVTDNMQLLYENNLPLIKQFIKPYAAYESTEDLLQEAYFGLWEAVQHYEMSGNASFMSYASYWIKQAAMRYIENCGSVIRVPSHKKQKILRYKKTVEKLSQEYKRTPTIQEISDSMNISVSEIQEIKAYMQDVSSLDCPLSNDSESTLSESIQADFSVEDSVIDKMYNEYSKNELWGIVERYTSNIENKVIADRYKQDMTYRDIGIKNNISMQRAREIEHNALRKLRTGKAKRTLLEKFEVLESGIYKTGVNSFKYNLTSRVEFIALRKIEIQEEYEHKLQAFYSV